VRVLMYLLTVLLGVLGVAGLVRFIERAALGAEGPGSPVIQLAMSGVFLLLAWKSLAKARSASESEGAAAQ
jgi:hypothetical protein